MYKVMIADDEIYITVLLARLVDWAEFDMEIVAVCHNGDEAYRQASEREFDLIVLDVRMPGMDGIALMQKLRVLNQKTRLIVISGYRSFDFAKGAIQNDAEDYLLKPISREELENVLRRTREKLDGDRADREKLTRTDEESEKINESLRRHAMRFLLDLQGMGGRSRCSRLWSMITTYTLARRCSRHCSLCSTTCPRTRLGLARSCMRRPRRRCTMAWAAAAHADAMIGLQLLEGHRSGADPVHAHYCDRRNQCSGILRYLFLIPSSGAGSGASARIPFAFMLSNRDISFGDAKEIAIRGSQLSPYCFETTIENIINGKAPTDGVVSHVFSLDQWEKAFRVAESRDAFKVVIVP